MTFLGALYSSNAFLNSGVYSRSATDSSLLTFFYNFIHSDWLQAKLQSLAWLNYGAHPLLNFKHHLGHSREISPNLDFL